MRFFVANATPVRLHSHRRVGRKHVRVVFDLISSLYRYVTIGLDTEKTHRGIDVNALHLLNACQLFAENMKILPVTVRVS